MDKPQWEQKEQNDEQWKKWHWWHKCIEAKNDLHVDRYLPFYLERRMHLCGGYLDNIEFQKGSDVIGEGNDVKANIAFIKDFIIRDVSVFM